MIDRQARPAGARADQLERRQAAGDDERDEHEQGQDAGRPPFPGNAAGELTRGRG